MNQTEAIRISKEASAQIPAGARDRVWKRIEKPAVRTGVPGWTRGLAFAACVAIGFAVVYSSITPAAPSRFQSEAWVATATGNVTRDPSGGLRVNDGRVLVSTWAPGLKLFAANHHLEADVAVFSVEVAALEITVDVREGEVRVDGERVVAGRRWPLGPKATVRDFSPVTALEPANAAEQRSWVLAESAVRQGDYAQALTRFDALGGGVLRAEAALLKKGELQLRQLKNPAAALVTFDQARLRFPAGSLTQEISLSALEAALALEQWTTARARASEFLAQFPFSERQLDVRYVAALAAWQLDQKSTTCAELSGLQSSAFSGERRTKLEKLKAQCGLSER